MFLSCCTVAFYPKGEKNESRKIRWKKNETLDTKQNIIFLLNDSKEKKRLENEMDENKRYDLKMDTKRHFDRFSRTNLIPNSFKIRNFVWQNLSSKCKHNNKGNRYKEKKDRNSECE